MPSTNKQDLLQLCNQLHQTVDQMENGIKGRRKRNRKSGAAVRSRKSHKRKVAAAVSANAFTNVRLDGTSINVITPKMGSNNQPIIDINAKALFDADAEAVVVVVAEAFVEKQASDDNQRAVEIKAVGQKAYEKQEQVGGVRTGTEADQLATHKVDDEQQEKATAKATAALVTNDAADKDANDQKMSSEAAADKAAEDQQKADKEVAALATKEAADKVAQDQQKAAEVVTALATKEAADKAAEDQQKAAEAATTLATKEAANKAAVD